MKREIVAIGLIAAASVSRANTATPADQTILASAPLAIGVDDLGRAFSARFEPLIGKEGRTLFPSAKAPKKKEVSSFSSSLLAIDTVAELQANARAWILDASGDVAENKRFMTYRAIQLTSSVEVDDTDDPRQASPDAAYYLRRIYYGRVFEVVLSADATEFTSDVQAQALVWSADIKTFATNHRLEMKIVARGLKPKASAIFATTPSEIKDAYQADEDFGNPVPVLVEYRRVPGSQAQDAGKLEWKAPAPADTRIKIRALAVDSAVPDWTTTGLVAQTGDLIVGVAQGKISYSDWNPNVDASQPGPGGLDMIVGTSTSPAGKEWLGNGNGEIKLRVRDNSYKDNHGSYSVFVMLVPAAALAGADCGDKPCQ